jgi:hypothetical protein
MEAAENMVLLRMLRIFRSKRSGCSADGHRIEARLIQENFES